MKAQALKKLSLSILSALVISLHGESLWASQFNPLDGTRLIHAKELLGTSYNGSLVEKTSTMSSVTHFVYTTLQERLDGPWKKYAANLSATIISESERYGFDPIFVLAVIETESKFDPTVIGGVGEIGLMQVRPETAEWIAQKEGIALKGKKALKDPVTNIRIGIAYMAFLRKNFSGAANHYVAAYNMGPSNVRRLASQSIQPREYATRVMANYNIIYAQLLKGS